MSDWFWNAAYVQNSTQQEVATAIRETMEGLSEGNIRLVENIEGIKLSFAEPLIHCVSSTQKGWTAFWGHFQRFPWTVFETQSLSGVIVSGADKPIFEDGLQSTSWDMSLWSKGQLLSWTVSNPKYHFGEWGPPELSQIVAPFLISQGAAIDPTLNQLALLDQIRSEYERFKTIDTRLLEFTHPAVTRDDIEALLGMRAITALHKLPQIFDIPFIGPDYFILDLVTLFDLDRGLKLVNPHLFHIDHQPPEAERSEAWLDAVRGFEPLLFRIRSDWDWFAMLYEYAHIFYFQ